MGINIHKLNNKREKRRFIGGFALPTVLISSVVMMTVLLFALSAVTSSSTALRSQYQNKILREATEAGVTYASACIEKNSGIVTWTAAKPLTPNTDCSGNTMTSCSSLQCYVLTSSQYRTSFTVKAPAANSDGSYIIKSQGKLDTLSTRNGSVTSSMVSSDSGGINRYINNPDVGGGAGFNSEGHIGFLRTSNGLLYGFGDNSNNQIDDSTNLTISTPQLMTLPPGITRANKAFTSGQGASIICIIGQNAQVWCRGKPGGGMSEPGLMSGTNGWVQFMPAGNPDLVFTSATLQGQGGDTLCGITTSNDMYCAGDNYFYGGYYGLLGNATTVTTVPIDQAVKFGSTSDYKTSFNQDRNTCGINTNNDAYCVANNAAGILGNSSTAQPAAGVLTKYPLPSSRKVASIASNYHSYTNYVLHFLATDGTIWGSGKNSEGELGDGTLTQRTAPVQFGTRTDYVSMFSGPTYFCGITSSGDVYCTGDNTYGQLGIGGACNAGTATPTKVALPAGEVASTILSAQNKNSTNALIILTQSGNVYSAGDNTYGRFGDGTSGSCYPTPVKMQIPNGEAVKTIATTDAYSTYVMTQSGKPLGVGRNDLGQLGDGTTTNRLLPQPMVLPRASLYY